MKRKILLFLVLLGIGVFFKTNTFGAELLIHRSSEPSGFNDFGYLVNRPYPGETFNPGQIIRFQGYVTLPGCHNGLYYNKITFYVSDKKVWWEGKNACYNCLGASSGYEGIIIPDNQSCFCCYGGQCGDEKGGYDCEKVFFETGCSAVVIDEYRSTIPGYYKLYKFGAIYPPDIPYKGHPARRYDNIEFNRTYILPSDICEKLNLEEGEKIKFIFGFNILEFIQIALGIQQSFIKKAILTVQFKYHHPHHQ